MRQWRRSGFWLVASSLLFGCATGPAISSYKVKIPELTARPKTAHCAVDGEPTQCVILLKGDYETILRELAAACLASGASKQECELE